MEESPDKIKEEICSGVDDAASVIFGSKRKETFVRKNALEEKKSSVSGLAVFLAVILVLVALRAILTYALGRQEKMKHPSVLR